MELFAFGFLDMLLFAGWVGVLMEVLTFLLFLLVMLRYWIDSWARIRVKPVNASAEPIIKVTLTENN